MIKVRKGEKLEGFIPICCFWLIIFFSFLEGMHRYVHPDVLKEEQVHTLAALLKMYLRDLPEPLFSSSQYSEVFFSLSLSLSPFSPFLF